MAAGRHSVSGDNSLLLSVGRQLGGALALVLVVAAAFWGIGQVRTDDQVADGGPNPVISGPASPSDGATTPGVTPDPTATTTTAPPTTPPTPSAAPATEPAAAPVTVQVLDAVLDDGGASAAAVAAELRAGGYRVVATNAAIRVYQQTTVFYSPGGEDEGQRLADDFGFAVVEPKPDNLTDSVMLHVVVGVDDRA